MRFGGRSVTRAQTEAEGIATGEGGKEKLTGSNCSTKRRREHVGHVRVLTVGYLLHLGSPGLKVLRKPGT